MSLILPEILVLSLALLILIFNLIFPEREKWLFKATALGLLLILLIPLKTGLSFEKSFISDNLSLPFRSIFTAAALFIVLISEEFFQKFKYKAEYLVLTLFALLGMMITVSANDLILLFLGIELTTITFYLLAAFHKYEYISAEAGFKFFLQGTISSAVLLYGFSFLFGITGSTNFEEITSQILLLNSIGSLWNLALVLVITGFAFKIALFPFQLWIPDIYQGAPTPVTAFLSIGSKTAGFIALIRLLQGPLNLPAATTILVLLAIVTMLFGNLMAIHQINLKRFLAFSSIGHAGFILIGLITGTSQGIKATLFYLIAYLISNLLAFTSVIAIYNKIKSYELSDFKNLSQKLPILSGIFALSLLSLTGIPPFIGFFGKFFIFLEAINQKMVGLVIFALFNMVVAAYYYFKIIKVMYLQKEKEKPLSFKMGFSMKIAVFGLTGILVVLSIFPGIMLDQLN